MNYDLSVFLANELKLLLSPLVKGVENEQQFKLLLKQLGWNLPQLLKQAGMSDFQHPLDDFKKAFNEIPLQSSYSVSELIKFIENIRDLESSINTLRDELNKNNSYTRLDQFWVDLRDYLLQTYLEKRLARGLSFARLVGVYQFEDFTDKANFGKLLANEPPPTGQTTEFVRLPFYRWQFHFDALENFFTDPIKRLQSIAGNSDAELAEFYNSVKQLLNAWRLPFLHGKASDLIKYGEGGEELVKNMVSLKLPGDDNFGLSFALEKNTVTNNYSLIIVTTDGNYADSNIEDKFTVCGRWLFRKHKTSNLAALRLNKDSAEAIDTNGNTVSPFEIGFSAWLIPSDNNQPAFFLGNPSGNYLKLEQLLIDVSAKADSNAKVTAMLEIKTGELVFKDVFTIKWDSLKFTFNNETKIELNGKPLPIKKLSDLEATHLLLIEDAPTGWLVNPFAKVSPNLFGNMQTQKIDIGIFLNLKQGELIREIRVDWTNTDVSVINLPGLSVSLPKDLRCSLVLGGTGRTLSDCAFVVNCANNQSITLESSFAFDRSSERELYNSPSSGSSPFLILELTSTENKSLILADFDIKDFFKLPKLFTPLANYLETFENPPNTLTELNTSDFNKWQAVLNVPKMLDLPFLNRSVSGFDQTISVEVKKPNPTSSKIPLVIRLANGEASSEIPLLVTLEIGDLTLIGDLAIDINLNKLALSVKKDDKPLQFRSIDKSILSKWLGLSWEFFGKKDNGSYHYFDLHVNDTNYRITQAEGSRLEISYKALGDEPVVFLVQNFMLSEAGVSLTAKVSDRPARINGLNTRFRFTDSSFKIIENRIESFSLQGSGPLPPDLVGDSSVAIALQFESDGGALKLKAANASLTGNKPLTCGGTGFQFSIQKLGLQFVEENEQFHLYFLLTGKASLMPAKDNKELAALSGIDIELIDCPLVGDVSVLKNHINFLIPLPKPISFNFMGCFAMEIRGIGFIPTSDKCGNKPAMLITGQVSFGDGCDSKEPQLDYHRLYIGLPKAGDNKPQIEFEGALPLRINFGEAFKLEGSVTKVSEGDEQGFKGNGRLEIQGLPPMAGSFSFLRVRRHSDGNWLRAWFIYVQVEQISYPIPVVQLYLREVGLGFGYRYTLASIKAADNTEDLGQLIGKLRELTKTQGNLTSQAAWNTDIEEPGEDLRWTVVLSGLISQASAAKTPLEWNINHAEENLDNAFLLDAVVALRSDLTFLMAVRAWINTNYYDWVNDKKRAIKDNPLFNGFVLLSPQKKRLLAQLASNPTGYTGNLPEPIARAFKNAQISATLLMEPGLTHFELGWPNQLRWSDTIGPLEVEICGGMIIRNEEDQLVYGQSIEARAKLDLITKVDVGVAGAEIRALAHVAYAARQIGVLEGSHFVYYSAVGLEARVDFSINAWIGIRCRVLGKRIEIRKEWRGSTTIDFTASLEIALVNLDAGLRGHGRVAISVLGRSLELQVNLSSNPENVTHALEKTKDFLSIGLEAKDVGDVPGIQRGALINNTSPAAPVSASISPPQTATSSALTDSSVAAEPSGADESATPIEPPNPPSQTATSSKSTASSIASASSGTVESTIPIVPPNPIHETFSQPLDPPDYIFYVFRTNTQLEPQEWYFLILPKGDSAGFLPTPPPEHVDIDDFELQWKKPGNISLIQWNPTNDSWEDKPENFKWKAKWLAVIKNDITPDNPNDDVNKLKTLRALLSGAFINGSFEFQVGELLEYIVSVNLTSDQRLALCETINTLYTEVSLTPENISTSEINDKLGKAIEGRYPNSSNKLEDFLNDLKAKMNDNYPLKTYKSLINVGDTNNPDYKDPILLLATGEPVKDERVYQASDNCYEAASIRQGIAQFRGSPLFKLDPEQGYSQLLQQAFNPTAKPASTPSGGSSSNQTDQEFQKEAQAVREFRSMLIQDMVDDVRDYLVVKESAGKEIIAKGSLAFQMGLVFKVKGSASALNNWLETEALFRQRLGNQAPEEGVDKTLSLFNPERYNFYKKPPIFNKVIHYSNANTIAIAWELTWNKDLKDDQPDPEQHLVHYEVRRRSLGTSEMEQVYSICPVHIVCPDKDNEQSVRLLLPRFKLVEHFHRETLSEQADLPIEGRRYLYTITPVSYAGERGQPLTVLATRYPDQPPAVPVDASLTVRYELKPDTFEFQVGALLEHIASDNLTSVERMALCDTINTLCTEVSLTPENISILEINDKLGKAIEGRYPNSSNKLEDFLNDLKAEMNDNYPLKTYKSHNLKVLKSVPELLPFESIKIKWSDPKRDASIPNIPVDQYYLVFRGSKTLPLGNYGLDSANQSDNSKFLPTSNALRNADDIVIPINPTGSSNSRNAELSLDNLKDHDVFPDNGLWQNQALRVYMQTQGVNGVFSALAPVRLLLNFSVADIPTIEERQVPELEWLPRPFLLPLLSPEQAEAKDSLAYVPMPIKRDIKSDSVGYRRHPGGMRFVRFRWNQYPSSALYPSNLHAFYQLHQLDVDAFSVESFNDKEKLCQAVQTIGEASMLPASELLTTPNHTHSTSQWEAWYASAVQRDGLAENIIEDCHQQLNKPNAPWYSWRDSTLIWVDPKALIWVDPKQGIHPFFEVLVTKLSEIYFVERQLFPPRTKPKDMDNPTELLKNLLDSTPETSDPYGWAVLQHLGLSLTVTLRDKNDHSIQKPNVSELNTLLDGVLSNYAGLESHLHVELLFQTAKALNTQSRDFKENDLLPLLAMMQFSFRPIVQQTHFYLVAEIIIDPPTDKAFKIILDKHDKVRNLVILDRAPTGSAGDKPPQTMQIEILANTSESFEQVFQPTIGNTITNGSDKSNNKKTLMVILRAEAENADALKSSQEGKLHWLYLDASNTLQTVTWEKLDVQKGTESDQNLRRLITLFSNSEQVEQIPIALTKDQPVVIPFKDYQDWSKRFFNHTGEMTGGKAGTGYWLATAYPRPSSPALVSPDAQHRLQWDFLLPDLWAHNFRFYIQPFGRYERLWQSLFESPLFTTDNKPDKSNRLEQLFDVNAGGIDLSVDRLQAVAKPIILSSKRLDFSEVPGGIWEVIIAKHGEQSLIEHNTTLERRLAFNKIIYSLSRQVVKETESWLKSWPNSNSFALSQNYPAQGDNKTQDSFISDSIDSEEIAEGAEAVPQLSDYDQACQDMSERLGRYSQEALVLHWQGLPYYYEYSLTVAALTAKSVSKDNTIVQRDFEYRAPDAQVLAVADDSNRNKLHLAIRLERYWDCLPHKSQDYWPLENPDPLENPGLDKDKPLVSSFPEPTVVYQLAERFSGNLEVQLEFSFEFDANKKAAVKVVNSTQRYKTDTVKIEKIANRYWLRFALTLPEKFQPNTNEVIVSDPLPDGFIKVREFIEAIPVADKKWKLRYVGNMSYHHFETLRDLFKDHADKEKTVELFNNSIATGMKGKSLELRTRFGSAKPFEFVKLHASPNKLS